MQIKQLCQQHTFSITKEITRSMKNLVIEIVELQHLAETTGNRGHNEEFKALKKKVALADLVSLKAQAALVRSLF